MTRVLILGGTRFIGAAAVRALAASGHAVTCVHRGTSDAALPDSVGHVHFDHAELDSTRIRAELGYAERTQRSDTLAETVAWERDHPPDDPPALDYETEDSVIAGLA